MENLKKGFAGIILIILAVVVSVGGYFVLVKKSTTPITEPVFNSETKPTVIQPTSATPNEDFVITFPKEGSVLVEGQTYDITWSAPKIKPTGGHFLVVFQWGCMKDGKGCGGGPIAKIDDIYSQNLFSWTVPNLQTYLSGGDFYHEISPEDMYKITILSFPNDTIEGMKEYPSPGFKIIPK